MSRKNKKREGKMKKYVMSAVCLGMLLGVQVSFAASFEFVVPDTGQELCYGWKRLMCDRWHMEWFDQVCDSEPYCPVPGEDFYGQDGTYRINPPDLTDNGDGTVTDNVTGLMWEKKTDDEGAQDKDTVYTWKDALSYCENLYAGDYVDWRLPNVKCNDHNHTHHHHNNSPPGTSARMKRCTEKTRPKQRC